MSYIGNEPIVSATRTVTEVTATAGQTVFTANGGYTVGFLDVFINGSKLTSTDFTATNGSTVTLTEAAQVNDIVRLEALGTFQAANAVLLTGNSNLTGNLNVSGNLGVGTTSPSNKFESSFNGSGYWNGSSGWTGAPSAIVVTNTTNGGYDPVVIGRMTDSGGTSKNSFAIGTLGTSSWTAGNDASQTADMYFAVRNGSGGITERARITSTGDLRFNSGYGSVATAYGCRAWVNFNGTGTVAIRASGNVSSITDSGTGLYIINFTNAMPDANYSVLGTQNYNQDGADNGLTVVAQIRRIATPLTTTQAYVATSYNNALLDASIACFSVFR
jgi:hypothetical protein